MTNPVRTRRLVALAAAYVVALQSLLLPLAVAVASPLTTAVCITDNGAPSPAGHDGACACAAGCGMTCCPQGLADGATASLLVVRFYVRTGTSAPTMAPAPFAPPRGPQNPRAPPAA